MLISFLRLVGTEVRAKFKRLCILMRISIRILEIRVSQNLAKLGGGCTASRNSRFAYEAFRHSTSSSFKPKTLVRISLDQNAVISMSLEKSPHCLSPIFFVGYLGNVRRPEDKVFLIHVSEEAHAGTIGKLKFQSFFL